MLTNKQLRTLKKKIKSMLSKNNCVFMTFTFTDKAINETTQNNRIRAIKRFLNEQASEYILNIDYGKENHREHYHAIAKAIYKKIFYCGAFKLGAIKTLRIYLNFESASEEQIKNLIDRLSKHATKDTTRKNKIIYSREHKKELKNPYEKEIDTILWISEEKKINRRIQAYYNRQRTNKIN